MRDAPDLDPTLEVAGAASESRKATDADRNLRFNFGALLVHGMLGQTGFRLVQAPTFLPHFVSELAGFNAAVGIMRAVQSLGMFATPLVSAGVIEHRVRVKGLAVVFGGIMRVQILFLALIALFAPREYALLLTWAALGMLGLGLGLQGVVFNFLVSKAIPVGRRGVLLGTRNALATVTLFGVSILGGWFVDRYGFPEGYGYTFLVGFLLTAAGLGVFALLREPASVETREPKPMGRRLLDVAPLLRAEPDFRRYLVARVLATAGRGAVPFYIVFIARAYGVSGQRLAAFTILFAVAQGASTLLWGLLGDRLGFRVSFLGGLLAWTTGTLLLVLVPYVEAAYAVFLLVGAGWGGFMMSSQNLALEFGSERDRPLRLATANSLSEFFGMLAFLAAGFAADHAPLEAVFAGSLALQALAFVQMLRVREPRIHAPTFIHLD